MNDQLLVIPGLGKTFIKDFQRIGITTVAELENRSAEDLYEQLKEANEKEDHATSKNYLYVIRMAIYFANGGRDSEKLKWNYWKDKSPEQEI